jgi:hypothetical protein
MAEACRAADRGLSLAERRDEFLRQRAANIAELSRRFIEVRAQLDVLKKARGKR